MPTFKKNVWDMLRELEKLHSRTHVLSKKERESVSQLRDAEQKYGKRPGRAVQRYHLDSQKIRVIDVWFHYDGLGFFDTILCKEKEEV